MNRFRLLTLTVIAACALAACKEKPSEPAKPVAAAPAAEQARTKEQAMASLLELPEIKAWSAQIEKSSHGKAKGAVMEDNPEPRVINGKPYWQLSFVENRPERVHRRETFLVAQTGNEILVEDTETDGVVSLTEWRRNVQRVNVKSAD
jgi:hypothetical protein